MGSGHRNEKAWNTKCQRSGIATGTYLETSRRPTSTTLDFDHTEDDTFPGDDPNDDQVSALPHHEPKPPPKMAAAHNSVSSSGHRTNDTTVGPAHTEDGPENPRRSKRVRQPRMLYWC